MSSHLEASKAFLPDNVLPDDGNTQPNSDRYAEAALKDAKRRGLLLAVRARWIALAIIAVMIPIVNPNWEVIYYHFLLLLFALIGLAQVKVGTVGRSRPELILLFCDLALMTVVTIIPNPLSATDWPTAMQYHFGAFVFFFVLLAGGTLSYSWRTIIFMGACTAGLWLAGVAGIYWYPNAQPELTQAMTVALGADQRLASALDPHALHLGLRLQEMIAFMIVAGMLALTVRRSGDLLTSHAAVERERTNLARYFSPNVVEELSQNDEPFKKVRTQNVAVLFVDIVDFTALSDGRKPEEIIHILREFHGRMEHEVFKHGGTLDKYLGDGLMATFGTPFTSQADAENAIKCAQEMMARVEEMNQERTTSNQPAIDASFGLHYGPVVLGDIGANRLEFAVIGSTVNAASRLEGLTRKLGCVLVVSEDLINQAKRESDRAESVVTSFTKRAPQAIRGLEHPITIWTQGRRA